MLRNATLDDKYALERGVAYMSAPQALVRLMMLQRERDRAAGLNTAGFVSGYRGSPLGGVDLAFTRAAKHLERHDIRFQPGINEDLAATAVWGTQQLGLFPGARRDGVFALWYGKAPGVDRSGDVLRHGNSAGSARHGGVLLATGDDPAARSTTVADQTDHFYKALMIPILAPASVQEILDLGLHGYAMSRFSGCWIALKLVADVAEGSATVEVDPSRIAPVFPYETRLNIRYPDWMLEAEARLKNEKLYAALAYARANSLNRIVLDSARARIGLAAVGKAYGDLRSALTALGLDEARLDALGVRIFKISMPWPLEPESVRRFAQGLEEIIVIEEKRALVEEQLKDQLYHLPDAERPRIFGKLEAIGQWEPQAPQSWLVPPTGELTPGLVARALARRLASLLPNVDLSLKGLEPLNITGIPVVARQPWFCSGCPHNTSTRVPEGSRATAGIGCHSMAVWMGRNTSTWTHMGGEGVPWIGQAPFSETRHIFANLGDGTYYHSGLLAIRAALASGVSLTYKILYNDAVAMTGGQPVDGPISAQSVTRQVAAEGVKRIAVVSDEPEKYASQAEFAAGVTLHPRGELDAVQRELRQVPGVSVLLYDQTCAAEKRRRRKRGAYPDPAKRVFINEEVCEGCGDCFSASNCLSIEPIATEFGEKRRINQSSCNKDFSCVNGFCPSFVTVHGGSLKRRNPKVSDLPAIPGPVVPQIEKSYSILVAGIGGTGVVTVGALLGMAAHLEGKSASVLDVTGLAQKGGAVLSHVRLAARAGEIDGARIGEARADAVIACDLGVALSSEARSKLNARTRVAANTAGAPSFEAMLTIDATALAGDAVAVNVFMLGFALQKGLVPLSVQAVERAIELNDTAVELNKRAFALGRAAAHDPERSSALAGKGKAALAKTLDEIITARVALLTAYQDGAYADKYKKLVERVRKIEREKTGSSKLAEAVARQYAKLLAYKDEYEVARLYAAPGFTARVAGMFEGDYRLKFHLAPPALGKRKRQFGAWMLAVFQILVKLRKLRGSVFDPFGYSEERRTERRLIAEYEALVEELLSSLDAERHALAVELASLPDAIRGFGHVKAKSILEAKNKEAELLAQLRAPEPEERIAA
ncbi:MAG: indolepyruvate ferredoxin oxidoreductase family protein [Betaproteobacteria bacterium]|nr:MAG: indolepyruvate ferredoxin oxidoreductase family protein [Betaproteobacteria bacterium]